MNGDIEAGFSPDELGQLFANIARRFWLFSQVAWKEEPVGASTKDRENLYYTQSFAMAYYIMKVLKPKTALQFMVTLRKTKDVEAANKRLFGKERKNLPRMEKHWENYILKVEIKKD